VRAGRKYYSKLIGKYRKLIREPHTGLAAEVTRGGIRVCSFVPSKRRFHTGLGFDAPEPGGYHGAITLPFLEAQHG
jgi:hypothetical protein